MKVIGADQPPSSSPESNQAIPMSTNDSRGAELVRGCSFTTKTGPGRTATGIGISGTNDGSGWLEISAKG